MKWLLGFSLLFLVACAPVTQYTVFKAENESKSWDISCTQKGSKFLLSINGKDVVGGEFKGFDNNFRNSGRYNNHEVIIIGHKSMLSTSAVPYSSVSQIRVIIDGSEITKFDFY